MMNVLLLCMLGMAALAGVLWRLERHWAGRTAPGPGPGPARTPAPGAVPPGAVPPGAVPPGADPPGDCLCNQCEREPGCPLTFPACLQQGRGWPGPVA